MATTKKIRRSPRKSPRKTRSKSPVHKYLAKIRKKKVATSVKVVATSLPKRRSPRRKAVNLDYNKLNKLLKKWQRALRV